MTYADGNPCHYLKLIMTYADGNPCHYWWQAHKYGGVKPVNGSQHSSLDNMISNDTIHVLIFCLQ